MVHEKALESVGRLLVNALLQNQVQVLFGPRAALLFAAGTATADFDKEYGDLHVNFELVSSLDEAICHIHKVCLFKFVFSFFNYLSSQHGSSHTDCIITG